MLVLRNYFFVLLFGIFSHHLSAQQLTQSELDTCRIHYSLNSALVNPLEVYVLDLTKTKLSEFPIEILEMKNLHILKLGKNKISVVPDSIGSLHYLVELDLGKNLLSTFPMGITKLVNLEKLILNQNTIASIPFDIKNLQKLTYLDMWSNELSYFPDSMKELTSLQFFDLRVIQFTKAEQAYIISLLPNAKIMMSESCNCSH
jgi:Leucine-rich repeat (LRR) protein